MRIAANTGTLFSKVRLRKSPVAETPGVLVDRHPCTLGLLAVVATSALAVLRVTYCATAFDVNDLRVSGFADV